MRSVIVVQHDDRTPTGQRFASFCIRGIPGLVSSSTFMRRWPKGRLFSVAAFLAQAIVREGAKAVAAGMNPMDLKRGIELARFV